MNQDERVNRSRPGLSIAGKHATESQVDLDPPGQTSRVDRIRLRLRVDRHATWLASAGWALFLFGLFGVLCHSRRLRRTK
jgi:hypothetical protein